MTNDFYVGSSNKFAVRKREHWRQLRSNKHHNKHLQRSWDKHGESAFIFVVVESLMEGTDILAAENIWLKEHVGKPYCYNVAMDATAPMLGMFGDKNPMWGKTFSHTEDAKKRIAIASANRIQSEEEKIKRKQTMQGHQVTAETRAKISATLSGAGNFYFGKTRTKEFVEKVSKAVSVTYKGNVTEYPSIKALRIALTMAPPQVNRALKSNTPISKGKFAGMCIAYLK